MADLNDMTLEKFKLWSTNALRVYLSMRNKSVKGDFDTLAARAFITWEANIQVDPAAEQLQIRLLAEYKAKLFVSGERIKDPLTVTEGWLSEREGITKWPAMYIGDISDYLKTTKPQELIKRLVNEYKEGKAYRYFAGEWVKEVFYNDISEKSEICMLKSQVTPSQAVNNKPYSVWIIMKKDTKDSLGGQILQAYCTCTAGMLGSCNHIAGVLFRVEQAVKTGLTRPSCTSKPCEWTIPRKKTKVKPGRVSDFTWTKSKLSKLKIDSDKHTERIKNKRCFTPYRTKQLDRNELRKELYNQTKDDIPESCFTLLMEKRKPLPCQTELFVLFRLHYLPLPQK